METGRKREGQEAGERAPSESTNAKGGGWNFLLVEGAKWSERGITARATTYKETVINPRVD